MSNNRVEVRFFTSDEIRDRFRHQASRLGTNINNLVREGSLRYLAELEQQEQEYKTRKRYGVRLQLPVPAPTISPTATTYGPSFPPIRRSAAPTFKPVKLPLMSFAQEKQEVPEKMKRSFRKWAEFVEESPEDREKRMKVVDQEIIDKCNNDLGIYSATKALFSDFLEQREAAHVEVNRELKIEGDIGE